MCENKECTCETTKDIDSSLHDSETCDCEVVGIKSCDLDNLLNFVNETLEEDLSECEDDEVEDESEPVLDVCECMIYESEKFYEGVDLGAFYGGMFATLYKCGVPKSKAVEMIQIHMSVNSKTTEETIVEEEASRL